MMRRRIMFSDPSSYDVHSHSPVVKKIFLQGLEEFVYNKKNQKKRGKNKYKKLV